MAMQISALDGRAFEHIVLHRLIGVLIARPFELIAFALARRAIAIAPAKRRLYAT